MLVLLGGTVGSALAQDEPTDAGPTSSEVLWELRIPSQALPDDFVKLVVEDWTLAPGIDTTDFSIGCWVKPRARQRQWANILSSHNSAGGTLPIGSSSRR